MEMTPQPFDLFCSWTKSKSYVLTTFETVISDRGWNILEGNKNRLMHKTERDGISHTPMVENFHKALKTSKEWTIPFCWLASISVRIISGNRGMQSSVRAFIWRISGPLSSLWRQAWLKAVVNMRAPSCHVSLHCQGFLSYKHTLPGTSQSICLPSQKHTHFLFVKQLKSLVSVNTWVHSVINEGYSIGKEK